MCVSVWYMHIYVHVSVEARGPDPSTAGGTCCCELPDIGPGN